MHSWTDNPYIVSRAAVKMGKELPLPEWLYCYPTFPKWLYCYPTFDNSKEKQGGQLDFSFLIDLLSATIKTFFLGKLVLLYVTRHQEMF